MPVLVRARINHASMSTFADEFAKAAREGQKKRKRLEEFERDSLKDKLAKEWRSTKKSVLESAESSGATCFIIHIDFKKNQEYQPNNRDITDNLPEDLKKLRDTEGCDARLEYGHDGAHTWEIILSCTGRVNALNDKDLQAETRTKGEESDPNGVR